MGVRAASRFVQTCAKLVCRSTRFTGVVGCPCSGDRHSFVLINRHRTGLWTGDFSRRNYFTPRNLNVGFGGQSKVRKMSTDDVQEDVLLGVGNPLLDITVTADQCLLDKYKLLANNAIIAEAQHMPLFEELVDTYKPIYLAGGATQNSIRVAQWLLQKPNATTFFGGVGNDLFKDILAKKAEEVGVDVHYEVHSEKSTGKCAAVITGEDRSLITDLGAAELFTADFLRKKENWKLVEDAQVYYIGGFIVPVSSEAVLEVAKHAAANGKTVVMNLHATFLCKYFADPELNLMQYVDVLFGNNDEASEFAKCQGFEMSDLKDIAKLTANLPKENKNRQRTIIFTQGKNATVTCHGGEITVFPVTPADRSIIKDTNGCGDAFVGGFLSQLVQNKSLHDCMDCGAYAAKVVLQHFGCNYPSVPEYH